MVCRYIGEQNLKCSSSCWVFFGENHDLDILLQRNGETLLSVHLTMEKAPAYPACRHMLGKKRGPGGMLALEMKR